MPNDLTTDAIRALLDGATPGPWEAIGDPWSRIVWSSQDNRVCFMAHSNGLDDKRDLATSSLIAAAPDLARLCLSRGEALAAKDAEIARLREALEAMLHAVCGETGFAACVRRDAGRTYPWPALDASETTAIAALKGTP